MHTDFHKGHSMLFLVKFKDYAGPFAMSVIIAREAKIIALLQYFASRRTKALKIYSDNGTDYINKVKFQLEISLQTMELNGIIYVKRALTNAKSIFEEFCTIHQIESIFNSCPITRMSNESTYSTYYSHT